MLHPPDDLERLAPPPRGRPRDVLFRTYFWNLDRVYSRYPPGFPALLALAGLVGGEQAQHLVNPALFLALLGVIAWMCWAALRPHDRSLAAGTAVAAVWLTLLLPTQVHLWGSTVTRDLLAHLLGFGSLLAALYAAPASAGLLLGLACTVRPDAVLYGASLGAVLAVQSARVRAWVACAVAFLAGVVPLLLYNHATRGSFFAFTQASEFDRVLSSLGGSPFVVLAQAMVFPSGGGFRLAHLSSTLPANVGLLVHAFSWGLVVAAIGLVWSLRCRRVLAAALVPYVLVALPFYSCWPHPDTRYLAGISIALILFSAVGAVAVCRWLAAAASRAERIATVVGAVSLAALAAVTRGRGVLGAAAEIAFAAAIAAVSALAAVRGSREMRSAVLAPGFALALAGLVRMTAGDAQRDPFQRAQVARARAAIESVVPAGALVLVGEGLGQPAENIAHYTHAEAHYLSELALLRATPEIAVARYASQGRRSFVLVAADDAPARAAFAIDRLEPVERRGGTELYDWFVDPRRAPGGVVLYEVRRPGAS